MRNASLVSLLGLIVASCLSTMIAPAKQNPEDAAQQAVESWIRLVDSGKYADSWDEAAQLFKEKLTKPQWESAVQSVRTPLGKVTSRKLRSANYTKTLPGAPDGEYVVIQYETSFENKKSATETITPMKDKDGQWRVSGYFIK